MINVGIIGCGYWGPNLIRKFAAHDRGHVRWLCDLKEEKIKGLQKHYAASRITRDFNDVLRDPETDAVVIVTPLYTHYKIARKALEAGKHIFVEKPFVSSSKQAEELVRLAKKKKKILMVGYAYVYNPAVCKIKQLIDSGELGDIYYINSSRVNLGIFREKESVIWDLAVHDFSILLSWFPEEPYSVVCTGRDSFKRGVADTAMIALSFKSGMEVYVLVSWHSPIKMRNMTIAGSQKMVFFNDERYMEKIKIYNQDSHSSLQKHSGEYQPVSNGSSVFSPIVDTKDALTTEVEVFFDCITTGKQPLTDGRMGIRVVKILEAAEKSLASHRRVIIKK